MSKHIQASVEPITEKSGQLRQYLQQLNSGALIMSIVHMTGDTSILSELHGPSTTDVVAAGGESRENLLEGGYTCAEAALIQARALEAISAYVKRGCTLPNLTEDVIDTMFRYICGQGIDDVYLDFIKEEIALDGIDHRALQLDEPELRSRAADFPVVIIGAGMGGVLAAIRLKEAGVPLTVIEKNPGIGGTWYENRYPGCRVDVPGHSYSYSFEPNHDWESHYPLAREIQAYYDRCADEYGVREHMRFGTEVSAAEFDEHNRLWRVTVVDADGEKDTLIARALISAVGQLNRPKMPDIAGLDSFQGALIHSGAWPDGVDLAGKRVAVIGSGASAFQIIPELAGTAQNLLVFQRSPAWMFPNTRYHAVVSEGKKWALKKLPYYSKWYRFWLFYTAVEGVYEKTLVDPDWHNPLSVSASNDELRSMLTQWIESQVHDPKLLEKVLPQYPPFGKRILQDNGFYLSALQQKNVELVTSGIQAVTSQGIVTADGREHAVDAIVCATGFYADRFLFPMKITGRNGIDLNQQWGESDGRAYLGITVPNFPNLFCIYGPNTNLVVAGSIAHNAESQVNYILRCIRILLERDGAMLDCRQSVHDAYNKKVDEVNAATAWGSPRVNNWYKNSSGRVTANLPFRIIDYWKMTRYPNPSDYIIE